MKGQRALLFATLVMACREPLDFPSEGDDSANSELDSAGVPDWVAGLDPEQQAQLAVAVGVDPSAFDPLDWDGVNWDGVDWNGVDIPVWDAGLGWDGMAGAYGFDGWDPFDPDDLTQFGPQALSILPPDQRYQTTPEGSPLNGGPSEACEHGVKVPEVCGNGIDDDCDIIVDEEETLGQACQMPCSEESGRYACDITTNEVVCVDTDYRRCRGTRFIGCGNGFRDGDEQCDYASPDQRLGVTCTRDCRANPFIPCLFGIVTVWHRECLVGDSVCKDVVSHIVDSPDDVCGDSTMRCVEHVGTCLPSLFPDRGLQRCPDIPREPPPFCGNGIVDPGEECEHGYVDLVAGLVCAWDCRLALANPNDDPRIAPPWPMLEYEDGEGGPVDCVITCSDDDACPSSMPKCYMGRCVALLEEEDEQ